MQAFHRAVKVPDEAVVLASPRLGIGIYKETFRYSTSPCNSYPPGLHLEAIAFFDLKSQNKNCFWLRPETFSLIAKTLIAMSRYTHLLMQWECFPVLSWEMSLSVDRQVLNLGCQFFRLKLLCSKSLMPLIWKSHSRKFCKLCRIRFWSDCQNWILTSYRLEWYFCWRFTELHLES